MTIEADFEQLSPLVDDMMQHVARLPRSAFHKAALSSLLFTHMHVHVVKESMAFLHSGETIDDPDERIRMARLLSDHTDDAARLLLDVERAYKQAGRVQ